MIDYAHNAMSLESLLTTLKEYGPKRLVCLFGRYPGRLISFISEALRSAFPEKP